MDHPFDKKIVHFKQLLNSTIEASEDLRFDYATSILCTLMGLVENADIERIHKLALYSVNISMECLQEFDPTLIKDDFDIFGSNIDKIDTDRHGLN